MGRRLPPRGPARRRQKDPSAMGVQLSSSVVCRRRTDPGAASPAPSSDLAWRLSLRPFFLPPPMLPFALLVPASAAFVSSRLPLALSTNVTGRETLALDTPPNVHRARLPSTSCLLARSKSRWTDAQTRTGCFRGERSPVVCPFPAASFVLSRLTTTLRRRSASVGARFFGTPSGAR
jgi:hypothetical protein